MCNQTMGKKKATLKSTAQSLFPSLQKKKKRVWIWRLQGVQYV